MFIKKEKFRKFESKRLIFLEGYEELEASTDQKTTNESLNILKQEIKQTTESDQNNLEKKGIDIHQIIDEINTKNPSPERKAEIEEMLLNLIKKKDVVDESKIKITPNGDGSVIFKVEINYTEVKKDPNGNPLYIIDKGKSEFKVRKLNIDDKKFLQIKGPEIEGVRQTIRVELINEESLRRGLQAACMNFRIE